MDRILVFIPMYNCEKQIKRVLEKIVEKERNWITEVIVVNNRSTDNGEEVVGKIIEENKEKLKIKLIRNNDNYGLGGSHKVAFDYAIKNKFDYVVVLHGDDQGNINDIEKVIETKEYQKHDCMLGARFAKGSKLIGYSKFRIFGNRVFNLIFSIGLRKKILDLGSGLNMYKVTSLSSKYYLKYPDNLTFNCYMLLAAKEYKQDIKFFPITWREEDQVSNVKMASQATNTLKLIITYVFKKKKFLEKEHREKIHENYSGEEIRRII